MGAAQQLDIYGAKGGSDKPKTPTEAPDSLRSVAMAKILIAMGEGEFAGNPTAQDIYLDNTPLQDPQGNMNFPNVKWEYRSGSVEQGYIQGIPSIENETSLGIELRSGTPWVRAINNTELSAVRVRFAWPALQSVDASGNVNGYRIEYKIELATDGGAYQQVLSEAVDGKSTSTYERTRRIDLPAATSGWLMRITRITPNQNNNKIADTMQIAGFTEVIDAKLSYPNTALLYIEFSAEQFRNIPAVTVDCRARKWQVPSNYDPDTRSYTGIWDGTFKLAWTDNPAWVTYGITVNDRFGLGRRIKPWQVDKWELYRIAQYCDQLVPDGKGGQEPRFICNLNLQGKADAWSLLRDISAIYRGMTYWAQGQLFSLSDMPRATDFDFAYTRANVIDGKFTYSSASERTRYSRALISYDNPANNYDTDVTSVTDPKLQRRYGDNPLEISAIGCTRESEAQRRGKWALLTNSKDRGISFKVGLDGRIPLPGYVIPVADELLAGRAIGGRISAVAGRTITLDRDTQAKAGDRLILNLPNGKCEGRTVQSVAGRAVTVTVAYSVVPERELVWALDADDLAVPLYRVTAVSRPEPGVFEISAVQYDPSKFAHIDTGARLEERPISVIPITVVPAPDSVTLTASSVVSQGIAVATMTITWPAVPGAVGYDVEWRKDSGNWVKVQRTGMTSVDVTGIYAGAYVARVRAVSAFDISSVWRASILTNLKGKEGLPLAVSFLTATSLLFGIGLKWGFPAGAEDTQRTEIWYGPANNLAAATKLADLAYPQSDYAMQSLLAGARFFFWARLVDRTSNIGPFYPVGNGVIGQASADAGPILDQIAGQISETELGQTLLERIELIDGPPTLAGSVAQKVTSEAVARAAADLVNANAITKEVTDRAAAVLAEAQARAAEDLANAGKITQEATDRAAAVLAEAQARGAAITSEANTRSSADSALSTRIDTVTASTGSNAAAIQTEITARTNADSALGTRIDTVAAGTASNLAAIGTEITARTSADSALGTRIDTVVATATTDRNSASATVTGEATARANADTALGSRIDTVSSTLTGKADASAVTALTTRVTAAEGVNTSQGTAITGLQNALPGKADASAVNSLTTRVEASEGTISSQGTAITGLDNTLTRVGDNSPTKVYQSLFTDLAVDTWKLTTTAGPTASFSNIAGNTSGATLTMDGGATNKHWWGASTKLIRFDPSRLYKLTMRVQQISYPGSTQPTLIAGVDCFAEDGVTRINAMGANSPNSSHYVVTGGAFPALGTWVEYTTYVKGFTIGAENGGAGSGTVAVPKRLKTGTAYFSPMIITGYNNIGGVMAMDFYTVEDVTDQVQIDATSTAMTALTSRVTTAEGTLTSQGTSITSLNNSLTTTNTNVTAAQTAANAANTLAGGKGKVLVQTGAPATADQLVQNLWIDITGGANTPKRWTGSAWSAVTDKVATDAAAAAANALTVANTKADASAVNSLTTRVTAAEGTISSQGTSITGLNNSLTTTNTNVTAAQNAANAANTLAGGKGKVLVQTTAPAAADQLTQNLWIDITGGANTPKRWTGSAWSAVTDKVATDAAAAAANALTVANTKADASAVSSLTTRVTATEDQITAQANKLDGIYVQVNPVLAGDAAGFAGSTASFVGVWSEQSARIEDGVALGQRIDVVTASVGEVNAAIQTETTARASADAALSSQITTVQAVANSASAAVQTVSQAQASTDGRLGTMWAVKMQINAQGQYVAAGIGLGIENGPAGLQSTFLVSADTFAVVNGINGTLSSPFAVTGGQVFIRSAFIQDLSLSFGKISDNIQSDNYVANSTGWKLSKAGGMELNSTVAGQGRVQVTNRAVKVWDANGVLRVQLGDLSA
ncbi:putative phage tail protein [Pseudomonas jessenii]|uniref:phage tail protein n=1 Tax=Pseudomonas jessenii TaxID=77298 RepID=UPI0039E1AFA6